MYKIPPKVVTGDPSKSPHPLLKSAELRTVSNTLAPSSGVEGQLIGKEKRLKIRVKGMESWGGRCRCKRERKEEKIIDGGSYLFWIENFPLRLLLDPRWRQKITKTSYLRVEKAFLKFICFMLKRLCLNPSRWGLQNRFK